MREKPKPKARINTTFALAVDTYDKLNDLAVKRQQPKRDVISDLIEKAAK